MGSTEVSLMVAFKLNYWRDLNRFLSTWCFLHPVSVLPSFLCLLGTYTFATQCPGVSTVIWGAVSFCSTQFLRNHLKTWPAFLWLAVWKTNAGRMSPVFGKFNWTASSLSIAFYLFLPDLRQCFLKTGHDVELKICCLIIAWCIARRAKQYLCHWFLFLFPRAEPQPSPPQPLPPPFPSEHTWASAHTQSEIAVRPLARMPTLPALQCVF